MLNLVALAQRPPSTYDRQCTSTMPISKSGRPPNHNFSLACSAECHRRIEYFLAVLLRLIAGQAGLQED